MVCDNNIDHIPDSINVEMFQAKIYNTHTMLQCSICLAIPYLHSNVSSINV